jgi:hypothetical protein
MLFNHIYRCILIVSNASSFTLSAVGLYTECCWLVLIIGGLWSICNNYCSVSRAWLIDVIAEKESYAPAFSLFSTLSIASGIILGATLARITSTIFFTFRTSFLVKILPDIAYYSLSLQNIRLIFHLIRGFVSIGCNDIQRLERFLSLLHIFNFRASKKQF